MECMISLNKNAEGAYSMKIYFVSAIQIHMDTIRRTAAVFLRMYGGRGFCRKKQKAADTALLKKVWWEEPRF